MEQSNSVKADAGRRRYRAYPTPAQAERLTGWGHSCRAVWNLALEQRQHLHRHRGVTLWANAQNLQLTRARGDLPWLADLPAQSAQQVLRQLDRAYHNWWNPEHPAGPPTFKKRSDRLAVSFPGQAVKVRCTACGHLAHADPNAALIIERMAAGQAVDSTRSHPRVARPARSRMREPLGGRVG